jgi:hypothetical protein
MNFNRLFSEDTLIKQLNVEDALTAAAYPASGSYIDVSQFERFAFLIGAGALTTETTCKVRQATANNGTLKDVTDATVVVPADGDDKWYLIEVQTNQLDINNAYKYATLALTGPTGGDDYGSIYFFGLNPGHAPVTQGADKGEVVSVVG